MKRAQGSPIIAWLTTLSLLFSLSVGIMIGDNRSAYAASGNNGNSGPGQPPGNNQNSGPGQNSGHGDKVSADLRAKVKSSTRNECVKTIVDPVGNWTPSLDSLVSNKGGKVSRS